MILADISFWEIGALVLYLAITAYLGWLGWRHTRTASDYMLAGRSTHPFIMALSYGSTFISTSAIVGFGGIAGMFGMSLLWLVFLNIFVGIFLAFVFLGGPTRRMGHRLDAHTFPELLGRRFQSKGIQVFVGAVIFLFMPLYAAAVIIGGCKFVEVQFGLPYQTSLLIFSAIVAIYVFYGGMKGVMYTDAFQGAIMIVGMVFLVVFTYWMLGGVTEGHKALGDLAPLAPQTLKDQGHQGWTAMPAFGFGDKGYSLWWTVVSTITLGVGIGVLAQPQLVVRFMTVKSRKELNRAIILGGLFILLIPGGAYMVGNLSNAYFTQHGDLIKGRVVKDVDASKRQVLIEKMVQDPTTKLWSTVPGKDGKPTVVPVVLDENTPYFGVPQFDGVGMAQGRSISVVYARGDPEEIIPTYIKKAMPPWFGVLFLLTLLAAAMSTLSGQFHALGTSIGRDVYEQVAVVPKERSHNRSMHVVRIGVVIGIILATAIAWYAKAKGLETMISRMTAVFFGLCTSSFLTAFVGALFFKRMTRIGALASMVVGFAVTAFWLLLVNAKTAGDIGLLPALKWIPEKVPMSILWQWENWPEVDSIVVAFPLSILTAIVVSAFTQPPDKAHLDKCFAVDGAISPKRQEAAVG